MKNLLNMALVALLLPGIVMAADTITLSFSPSVDSYVDQAYPTTSYSGSDTLGTQGTIGFAITDNQPTSVQQSYLQFDVSQAVSDIPAGATIESVVFGVYLYDIAADSAEPSVDLFYAEDNWDNSITWNTSPDEIGDTLGTQMNLGVVGYYEWDLLNNSEVSWVDTGVWTDGTVSFLLAPTNDETWNGAYFYSSEGQYQPYLKITYSVVPAPGSITLAVLGLSSIAAIRRKKAGL